MCVEIAGELPQPSNGTLLNLLVKFTSPSHSNYAAACDIDNANLLQISKMIRMLMADGIYLFNLFILILMNIFCHHKQGQNFVK